MATPSNQGRTYSAAHFVLSIDDGNPVGVIRSIDGGGVKSEIMTYQMGSNYDHWRQIGKPKYEDLKIEFGMSMSKTFYLWIQSFFDGKVLRKSGSIQALDFQYAERARRDFMEGLISEISFPKLDGSDKNPCYMTATIVPELLRFAKGSGKQMQTVVGKMNQKLWTAANFEFTIDGPLKDKCRRVTKIDGFTIKQQVHEYHSGDKRDSIRVPGRIEFPNLTFYVPEADADPFIEHYTKYGIEGKLQMSPRLKGAITLRDHANDDLCTITLSGVDIAHIAPEKGDSSSEEIKQVKIEISVESMSFEYNSAALG